MLIVLTGIDSWRCKFMESMAFWRSLTCLHGSNNGSLSSSKPTTVWTIAWAVWAGCAQRHRGVICVLRACWMQKRAEFASLAALSEIANCVAAVGHAE